ncbi:MAG: hypothetical protein ACXWJD_10035 [Burkholderiaceae bacterium]
MAQPLSLRGLCMVFATCASLAVNSVGAASMLDFDIWMRKIDKRVVDVQKKMDLHDDVAATKNAKEMEELYKNMEDYFVVAGNADEGVKISRDGKEQAGLIVASIEAKDYEAGSNAAVAIAKACTNCHELYRPFK